MKKKMIVIVAVCCVVLGIVAVSSLWGVASGKRMLHITSDGTSTPSFGQNVELKAGVSYTVSFKYHAKNNGLAEKTMTLRVKDAFGSGSTTTHINIAEASDVIVTNGHVWAVSNYTFMLPEGCTDGTYGIGFQPRKDKPTDMYISDFDIFQADEPSQSLISNKELGQGLEGWRGSSSALDKNDTTWGTSALKVEILEFDDTLFQNEVEEVYLSSEGDDYADGVKEKPLRTLKAAVKTLKSGGTIYILDSAEYTPDTFSVSKGTVNIVGESVNAVLTITDDLVLSNNLGIDNLVIAFGDGERTVYTKGYKLALGPSISYSGRIPSVIMGNENMSAEKIELGNGNFKNVVIGGEDNSAKITKLYGKEAEIERMTINTNEPDAIVQAYFEKSDLEELKVENGSSFHSVGIINNYSSIMLNSNIKSDMWYIASEQSGDSRVEFTNQTGAFNTWTEEGKLPIAVSKDGTKVYTAQDNVIQNTYNVNQKNTQYSDYINYRTSLVNSYRRLTEDKELRIVYFGGSVTSGTGASDKESYSWRALVGKWFKEQFPNADIHNINKAVGESGTYLGAYRTQRDIIAEQPDLLFVEYSINDHYYGCTKEQAASQFETIVREVKEALPNCDIVTVLVTDKNRLNESRTELHTEAQAHEEISEVYGLPSIKVGLALANELGEGFASVWDTYFTDKVHPTDAGYAMYYKYINEYLENALLYTDYGSNANITYTIPPVQSDNLFDGNRVVVSPNEELLRQSETLGGVGFKYSSGYAAMNDYYGYYYATKPEDGATDPVFAYTFNGTEVAMMTNGKTSADTNSSGVYYYQVDGGEWQEGSHKSHNPSIIISGLTAGEHTVRIKPDFTGYSDSATFQIRVIFSRDASKQTQKGTMCEINTTLVGRSLIIPEGIYKVSYLTQQTVGSLDKPQKNGYVFVGWQDEQGDILTDETILRYDMNLTAVFEEQSTYYKSLDPFVNADDFADDLDVSALRKGMVGQPDYKEHDVNGNAVCDVVDLVALLNYLDSFGDNDVTDDAWNTAQD